MARRFAAISGLALLAGLAFGQPARAQNFFSFYEVSPRQIVGMLQDDGYELRGPMYRRGDVYVCDVVSISGRRARLIVAARDGHILDSYAIRTPHTRDSEWNDGHYDPRPPRDVGDPDSDDEASSHHQTALGDLFNPPSRVYGADPGFSPKTEPDTAPPPPKPKRHVVRKHKEPTFAKAPPPAAAPSPEATSSAATSPDAPSSDKPAATPPSSVAAVAPTPEPSKPAVEAVKPAPKPVASPPPVHAKVEAERSAAPEPKPTPSPKPDAPHKKINDLPVGTLD